MDRNSGQDALRGLLGTRFTAPELFRAAAGQEKTVGLDDLDDVLLRTNLTVPLKVSNA